LVYLLYLIADGRWKKAGCSPCPGPAISNSCGEGGGLRRS